VKPVFFLRQAFFIFIGATQFSAKADRVAAFFVLGIIWSDKGAKRLY